MTDGNSTTESSLLVSEHTTGTDTQSLQASTAVINKSDGDSEDLGEDLTTSSDLRLLELSEEESTGTEETFIYSDAKARNVTTTVSWELLKNKIENFKLEARSDSLQETKKGENEQSRSLKVTEVSRVFPSLPLAVQPRCHHHT